ncbi:hypothetical protein V5F77_04845 [Xanthobacter sp. DSM 24535]|uniref:hypothetical protein n=1 Tax=Roseixanthobacter psychrophilus TaxID=3119917 RepID=UPI00372C4B94
MSVAGIAGRLFRPFDAAGLMRGRYGERHGRKVEPVPALAAEQGSGARVAGAGGRDQNGVGLCALRLGEVRRQHVGAGPIRAAGEQGRRSQEEGDEGQGGTGGGNKGRRAARVA